MKRRLVLLLLFLMAGAIVNVAVAWWIMLGAGYGTTVDPVPPAQMIALPPQGPVVTSGSPDRKWIIASGIQAASTQPLRLMYSREAPSFRERRMAATPYEYWYGSSLTVYEAGWPRVAFKGAIFRSASGTRALAMLPLDNYVPIRPRWPAFAINTAFYAVVVWVAWLAIAPFARWGWCRLREGPRIRRGLCPKCAYDLRGSDSPSCPECGATR